MTLARKAHRAKKAIVASKALLAQWVPLALPVRKVNKVTPAQSGLLGRRANKAKLAQWGRRDLKVMLVRWGQPVPLVQRGQWVRWGQPARKVNKVQLALSAPLAPKARWALLVSLAGIWMAMALLRRRKILIAMVITTPMIVSGQWGRPAYWAQPGQWGRLDPLARRDRSVPLGRQA